jgi:hypothetical protein
MLKGVAPLAHPAEVMVLIDCDMLVTRSLEPLIKCAGEGHIVAFEDHNVDRFRPEWGQLLDLGDLRRQPYLSAGLVALGAEPGDEVLRLLNQLSDRVDFERTAISGAMGPRPGHPGQRRVPAHAYPFLYADQDLLNAILAGCVKAERVVALEYGLAPMWPFRGVQLLDERSLRCAYKDGTEPYLLHTGPARESSFQLGSKCRRSRSAAIAGAYTADTSGTIRRDLGSSDPRSLCHSSSTASVAGLRRYASSVSRLG